MKKEPPIRRTFVRDGTWPDAGKIHWLLLLLLFAVTEAAPAQMPSITVITNPTPATDDNFGSVVAAVGTDKLCIGAFRDSTGATSAGAAYLYSVSGSLLITITNPTPAANDWFGGSLTDVGTDKVLIGAYQDDTGAIDAGAAYLFSTNGTLLTTFTNPAPTMTNQFGYAVAAVGSGKVLIGARYNDVGNDDAGAAYLFSTNGTLLTTFTNPAPANSDNFGNSVAAVGTDKVLIGAYNDDGGGINSGTAYLFSTNGSLLTTFTNPTPANGDNFGWSVAAVGMDKVLIGARYDNAGGTQAGAAYLFRTNGILLTTYTNPNPAAIAYFGYSVAPMGTDKVLIGAYFDDTGAMDTGAAHLFSTNGTLLFTFTNPTPEANDYFGQSVASLGTDKVLIGTPRDNAGASHSGTVYLFSFDAAPPMVSLTSPTNEATYLAPATLAITASATDTNGAVARVDFRANGNLLGSDTNSPFEFDWSGVGAGSYSLTAVATDNGGLSATSAPVSITVQTAVPEVALTSPTNGNFFVAPASILLNALVSDADNSVEWVEFLNGGALVASVTNLPYRFTWTGVAEGTYSLSAVVHDVHGPVVTSAPPVVITVGNGVTNAPVFSWSNATVTVSETAVSVTVHILKNAGSPPASLNYFTQDRSASSTGFFPDYSPAQGPLSFAANETSKPLTITLHDDQVVESNQFFTVTISPLGDAAVSDPAVAVVTLTDNDLGQTNSITQGVAPSPVETNLSTLRVDLLQDSGFGQWRFAWELDWRNGGTVASSLPGGNYEIEFKPVNGYVEPARTPLPVLPGTNQVETFSYTNTGLAQSGSLQVTLLPGSLGAAAGWKRVGEASYHASGETVDSLPVGSYTIEFKPVGGWVEPGRRLVTVSANRKKEITVQYTVSEANPGTAPAQVSFSDIPPFGPNRPYTFAGQILSESGWGSGWVAKERVVLTAGHVVYDDVLFSFVPVGGLKWFFQRYKGSYEPAPKLPRGSCVMAGYAARREADATPGFSSLASQDRDVAAMYFFESAARGGGYGGYLVSKPGQPGQEWLFDSGFRTLVGYPVEGKDALMNPVVPGRLYATALGQPDFTVSSNRVYQTLSIQGLPGMSGGPLCVQYPSNNSFFPAAVYLGGSQRTMVRLIDTEVAELINCAEILGDGGQNNTGGGPIRLASGETASPFFYGFVTVHLLPAAVTNSGASYRFRNPRTLVAFESYVEQTNRFAILGNNPDGWRIEFAAIPGYIAPAEYLIKVATGGQTNFFAKYQAFGALEAMPGMNAVRLLGSSGSWYRVEHRPALGTTGAWTTLQTQQLTASSALLTNVFPAGVTNRFFRAILQP